MAFSAYTTYFTHFLSSLIYLLRFRAASALCLRFTLGFSYASRLRMSPMIPSFWHLRLNLFNALSKLSFSFTRTVDITSPRFFARYADCNISDYLFFVKYFYSMFLICSFIFSLRFFINKTLLVISMSLLFEPIVFISLVIS